MASTNDSADRPSPSVSAAESGSPTRSAPPDYESSTASAGVEALMTRLEDLRDRPALAAAIAIAIAVVVAGGWWLGRPGAVAPVEAGIPLATATVTTATTPPSTGPEVLLVHVAGAVVRPGLVELDPGARIADAVTAAGGPSPRADLHQLNLAAPVTDGLQVRVPVEGESVSPVGVPPATDGGGPGGAGGPIVVNINTASETELQALPGIGPSLAAAIVEWRGANGGFAAIDDLLGVPGIGPAKLDGLADHVSL